MKRRLPTPDSRLLTSAFRLILFIGILSLNCARKESSAILDHEKLAKEYFQADAQWYVDNIPFFECSDKDIEQVYYYRWQLYKAHIRHVGTNQYIITEFINHVPWDREPYCTINAASMHHINEGRWLKDQRYMNGYINNLYQDGGNDRRYTESIADAAYARYLVNGDAAFIVSQLDSMEKSYRGWSDHFEQPKDLYYIAAMPDATEYTIASIDATDGKDGFEDGEAFRPTINSYMYANAMAISRIAAMKHDEKLSKEYLEIAKRQKQNIQHNLWNDSLRHFTDRFKVNNDFVHYWDFIRGRELAGMIPWCFDVPEDSQEINAAWKHVLDTSQLLGKYGLRTQEPSYEYYFKQYQFFQGKRGSQWNGPSWPYQTSQVITGMANLLNDYQHHPFTSTDYLHLLRLFARQHYLPDGKINLVENYDPNLGGPIVYFYWSNHYNHSSFNDLVISGLCGIRPSAGGNLTINPLIDDSIRYFCLDGVLYHGHSLTIVYDKDGNKYKKGRGLNVFVDGEKSNLVKKGNKYEVSVGEPVSVKISGESENYALNIAKKTFPKPTASVNSVPDSLFQAIDGKAWYFPEISNYWSTLSSGNKKDWFALDFDNSHEISSIKISFYGDGKTFNIPDSFQIEYRQGDKWIPAKTIKQSPRELTANTTNTITIDKITTNAIRLNFSHSKFQVAISELECY